jgi:hypothetical protein
LQDYPDQIVIWVGRATIGKIIKQGEGFLGISR